MRFNNKGVRDAIYRNRVPKDVSKRGFFIHESLTTTKVQTVTKCAKLRREGKIVTYYTQSGHAYVKKTKESPSLLLSDNLSEQEILDMLMRQPTSYREAVTQRTAVRPPAPEQSTDEPSGPPASEATSVTDMTQEQPAPTSETQTQTKVGQETDPEPTRQAENPAPERQGEAKRETRNSKVVKDDTCSKTPNQRGNMAAPDVQGNSKVDDKAAANIDKGGSKPAQMQDPSTEKLGGCQSDDTSDTSSSTQSESKKKQKKKTGKGKPKKHNK